MLKVMECFGGIGACTSALKRIGVDFQVVDYVEIDKYAVASYNAINDTNYQPQDISQWDKNIEVDLIMHGSPCQDFSLAGKQAGGDEGSGTRSSLMYETLRIIEKLKPKYVIWENVKNLLSKNHIHNFNKYLDRMEELGYSSYYKVLNAADYGVPQKRERVFTVSILGSNWYDFPQKQELKIKLKDLLEDNVDERYYLSDKRIEQIINWKAYQNPLEHTLGNNSVTPTITATAQQRDNSGLLVYSDQLENTTNLRIKCATKQGYLEASDGDGCYITAIDKKRGTVQKEMIPTLKTSLDIGVVVDGK